MRLGRASLRLTGLPAAGLLRRKLRTDLKVSEQVVRGETTYMIKPPDRDLYLRYPGFAWEVLSLFDGTRTEREVLEELKRREPATDVTLEDIEGFVSDIDPSLWERTAAERNLALIEKVKTERQQRASEGSVFYMYFSAWDPNAFFDRVVPWLRWTWTPGFLAVSAALILAGATMFIADFDRIGRDTLSFYNLTAKSPAELWDFWFLLLIVGFIHESAHGLTCKNFGGEVHQMGFMLVYFTPAFYVDVSDIYLFDKRTPRLWTIFAGIYIETAISAACLLVWAFSAPGTLVNEWAYKMMLMTSITAIALNLNPLMKFDGYLALAQILQMENLREESFEYLERWARHFLGGEPIERAARREHRIYLVYGLLAWLYSALILVLVFLWVKNASLRNFGAWGWLLAMAFAYWVFWKRVAAALAYLRAQLPKLKEAVMAWSLSPRHSAALAAGLALVALLPLRTTVSSDFVLEPGVRSELRAPTPGFVREVKVRGGEGVEAGALVAVLGNPELEARGRSLGPQMELAEQALRAAQARGDFAEGQRQMRESQRLRTESLETRRRLAGLELRAPAAGTLATDLVEQRVGEHLEEGDVLGVLADRRTMRARVLVRDSELEDVREGAPVRLKVNAHPLRTFQGRVTQILPAAAPERPVARPEKIERHGGELFNYFAVTLEFPNPDGALLEGMTGAAKISGPRRPLLLRAARGMWRWARAQIWL